MKKAKKKPAAAMWETPDGALHIDFAKLLKAEGLKDTLTNRRKIHRLLSAYVAKVRAQEGDGGNRIQLSE